MGSGLNQSNPTIVDAFHTALLHQGVVVLVLLAALAVAWNVLRGMQLRRAMAGTAAPVDTGPVAPEPSALRLLRIGFGLLWLFDGLLQAQSAMPLGMTPQVIQPATAGSPGWVHAVVGFGEQVWSYHPVAAAAATVWIQCGIGLWLLAAPRGRWSRAAGLASLGWGLVVWVFGEAFGSIFAPGLTWLFGSPGAVLFYCLAGVMIALPERVWVSRTPGLVLLRVMGAFFVGMALLQAWPGRGFWQGGANGTLAGMVASMVTTSQPHFLSSWVAAFGGFVSAHGWSVNLAAVVALFGLGGAFLVARRDVARLALAAAVVLCLADWVLVEDLGFLGGVGTDPNSMIPILLVLGAGYLALVRPAPAPDPVIVPIQATASSSPSLVERLGANPSYALRAAGALAALGLVLLGVVPMAAASTNRTADPILSQAINGSPGVTDAPAPSFALVDQDGQAVSLETLRGKVVALTFLDPVCTSDCPIIAQEFKTADAMLGSSSRHVVFVAICANPIDTETAFLQAFDNQERLSSVPNWRYLTGSASTLRSVWNSYGVQVDVEPGGAMIAHSDIAYVIDGRGVMRYVLYADPGPATWATQSSFSATIAKAIETTLRQP